MKKIICFVLTIMMLMSVVPGFAMDFTGYSVEELINLYNDVSKELIERKANIPVLVFAGQYTIGLDIPNGDYYVLVDNRYGKEAVSFNYHPYDGSVDSIDKTISIGSTFEIVFTVFDNDQLSISGPFSLTAIID